MFASDGPEEVRQAWEAGLITHDRLDGWECEPLIIMTAEWNVLAKISAWWENGLVHAYLAVAAKHPE